MQALLLLVPLLTGIFGMLIYRFQDGKKQLFKLDLVQFIYLFVMSPALFVWLKTFLFYLLRNELDLSLTINDVFVIDTVYSIGGFYLFGAISMHTLTKTFWLRRHHDPEFDIYHLSEYFHLWWTHLAMTTGVRITATLGHSALLILARTAQQLHLLQLTATAMPGIMIQTAEHKTAQL